MFIFCKIGLQFTYINRSLYNFQLVCAVREQRAASRVAIAKTASCATWLVHPTPQYPVCRLRGEWGSWSWQPVRCRD